MSCFQLRGWIRRAPELLANSLWHRVPGGKETRMEHGGRKEDPAESGGAVLTRRNLLELAGLTFATALIPRAAALAKAAGSQDEVAPGVSPVMDKLSRYMS